MNSVNVRLQQVSWVDSEPAYLYWLPELDNVCVGMRDADALRKAREIQFLKSWNVPNRAIGGKADTAQGLRDLCGNLSKHCTRSRRMINILQHHNFRIGNTRHVFPPIYSMVVTEICDGRRSGTHSG